MISTEEQLWIIRALRDYANRKREVAAAWDLKTGNIPKAIGRDAARESGAERRQQYATETAEKVDRFADELASNGCEVMIVRTA